MQFRPLMIVIGCAALAFGMAVGCEREVSREERIERRNGEVEIQREIETVDPVRDVRREVEEEQRVVEEPLDD